MGALGVVQLEGAGERLQHQIGDAAEVAALQALVVIDADASERCDLFTAQAGHAPLAVGRQTCLLGRDPRSPRTQELCDVARAVHVNQSTSLTATKGDLSIPLSQGPLKSRPRVLEWRPCEPL